jgi:hypothetical protein
MQENTRIFFINIFSKQIAHKHHKNYQEYKGRRRSAQKGGSGPNRDGSWIIQTHQGRWIDPVPLNPRSNGQKSMREHSMAQTRARGINRQV